MYTRNHEEQPNLVIHNQVTHRVEPVVSGSIRDYEGMIIQDSNESRRIPTWTDVDPVIWSRCSNNNERRMGNKKTTASIKLIENC